MKILTIIFCLFLSVNAMGQNTGHGKPLYVVNGVIVTNEKMGYLNPANIKSITVLKGHAATALYGQKAANGVILITTKDYKVPPRLSKFALLKHAIIATPDSLKPLIAIDGAIYKGDINAIDSSKIKSVEFVKPEWTTVIYGKAGTHGVVDIKMKPDTVADILKKQ